MISAQDHESEIGESVIHDFGSIASDILMPNLGFLIAPGGRLCSGDNDSSGIVVAPSNDCQNIGDDADFPGGEVLYGVDQGGANEAGAVYVLTPPTHPTSWTETILYSFQPFQSGDAASPSGELVRDFLLPHGLRVTGLAL